MRDFNDKVVYTMLRWRSILVLADLNTAISDKYPSPW